MTRRALVHPELPPDSRDAHEVVALIPADARKLLGKGALIPGEDAAEYEHFLAEVSAAAKPKDALEWLLTEDVVALAWEVNRLRRLKAGLLRLEQREALATVLQKAMPYREARPWR
jgi:hypothetical protein